METVIYTHTQDKIQETWIIKPSGQCWITNAGWNFRIPRLKDTQAVCESHVFTTFKALECYWPQIPPMTLKAIEEQSKKVPEWVLQQSKEINPTKSKTWNIVNWSSYFWEGRKGDHCFLLEPSLQHLFLVIFLFNMQMCYLDEKCLNCFFLPRVYIHTSNQILMLKWIHKWKSIILPFSNQTFAEVSVWLLLIYF